jgi:hypothetical protein
MKYMLGTSLIVAGVIIMVFGDRQVESAGRIAKAVSHTKTQATLVKWAISAIFFIAGVSIMAM